MIILAKLSKYFINNYNISRSINVIALIRKRTFSNNALNVNTNVVKDVILYKYENPRFYKLLNVFAICQFGFWTYLSHTAYMTLKDAPVEPSSETVWWRKINLGENKYRNTITVLCFIIGYGIVAVSWMFTLRSVRYLILRKGGKEVTFVTYTPLGVNRLLTVNLDQVSCQQTRDAARSQLPIKVKKHFLHYILDMKGEFRNTALFDHTAGLKRNLRKA